MTITDNVTPLGTTNSSTPGIVQPVNVCSVPLVPDADLDDKKLNAATRLINLVLAP